VPLRTNISISTVLLIDGVNDVDTIHARAAERGLAIAYPLRDEEWAFDASCFASRAARA
jgi:hypothetical protein